MFFPKTARSTHLQVAALCLLLVSAGGVPAQERGSVRGAIADAAGSPLEGVRVSLVNALQTVFGSTETDARGRFEFRGVPEGTYAVLASKAGFADGRAAVEVGGEGEVSLALDVAPLADEVTVTAETGQAIERERVPQAVSVVSDRELRERVQTVLAEAAEEEVGVHVQRTSPTIGAIYVRGMTGKNVAVYVDGVRYTTSAQRGGISTFFNLNEPTSLSAIEILRGPNSAQYGSDSLGGTVHLLSRVPAFGGVAPEWHADVETYYSSPTHGFGGNLTASYGTERFGLLASVAGRRTSRLRPAAGLDGHAAVTRFLGLPSDVFGDGRLPDTAFSQYGGTLHASYGPTDVDRLSVRYQRSQQDGGKRYDQLLGGDGNLVADLRNLMLDFGYVRYDREEAGFFDQASLAVSYNSQREERVNQGGNGNPLGPIAHQYERTSVWGFNGFASKRIAGASTLLLGADLYSERVTAPAFTYSPVSETATPSRPRVPNGARYLTYGLYAQSTLDMLGDRVRLSGALRYGVASYRSRASESPLVRGARLFPDDSLRVDDVAGRVGVVVTPWDGVGFVFNYSRGFRAPDVTELGTLGLTGDGFEVAYADIAHLGGTIGASVPDGEIVSTGLPVEQLRSEVSNNYDLGFRLRFSRFRLEVTGFVVDLDDTLTKQPLILPQGSVGRTLGDQPIIAQDPEGTVYVPLSSAPVLVRANFVDARQAGVEGELEARLTDSVTFGANFTAIRSEDRATGAPPNIEGGTPPATANLRLRYAPDSRRYWVEVYSTLADDQNRLSPLDLADRRTGGRRTRGSIASFFNNGARFQGLVGAGADGLPGTGDDVLLPTGETLAEVQDRLVGDADETFLFPRLPGYGLVGLRGGVRLGERSDVLLDFSNVADKSFRGPSWGVDGPGRGLAVRYRYRY